MTHPETYPPATAVGGTYALVNTLLDRLDRTRARYTADDVYALLYLMEICYHAVHHRRLFSCVFYATPHAPIPGGIDFKLGCFEGVIPAGTRLRDARRAHNRKYESYAHDPKIVAAADTAIAVFYAPGSPTQGRGVIPVTQPGGAWEVSRQTLPPSDDGTYVPMNYEDIAADRTPLQYLDDEL